MPEVSNKEQSHLSLERRKEDYKNEIQLAIVKTLAFFSLYDLPLNQKNIHQLLYKASSTEQEVETALKGLVEKGKLIYKDGLYGIKSWEESRLNSNRQEIDKRWKKVNKFFWALSTIPFIDQLSIINSLALGNAHQESDIDFFVVTQGNRLYFVRSMVIAIFRLLGVYKTRDHINERFCFGFYVTDLKPELAPVLIEGEDPLFAFWFASFAPLTNRNGYLRLVNANPWIYSYFPNFDPTFRLTYIRKKNWFLRMIKGILEIVLTIPAIILEPILRYIHIRHTFNLPENHWPTATTVANKHMLKLHALDPRIDMRAKFYEILKSLC